MLDAQDGMRRKVPNRTDLLTYHNWQYQLHRSLQGVRVTAIIKSSNIVGCGSLADILNFIAV
jgi:hypothetical protein